MLIMTIEILLQNIFILRF